MDIALTIAAVSAGYLIGSVPSSWIVAKWVAGIDIRTYGSGNVGASNVATHVSKKWMAPVAIFDVFAKSWIPIYVVSDRVLGLGDAAEVLTGLAAVAGHNWPIFLRFSGGRAISVAIGGLGAFATPLIVIFGTVPVIMALASPWRDSGFWWLLTALMMPGWAWLMLGNHPAIYFTAGFAVLMIIRRATSDGLGTELARSYGISLPQLILNRIVFDRDIADREEWVHRRPAR